MDDSTQGTSSESELPEDFSRNCGQHSQEHAASFSLCCGEQSGRRSLAPDISHVLTPAGLHVVGQHTTKLRARDRRETVVRASAAKMGKQRPGLGVGRVYLHTVAMIRMIVYITDAASCR